MIRYALGITLFLQGRRYRDMKKVYLAGPIEGCTLGEITGWRDYVKRNLANDIMGISPYRAEELDDKYGFETAKRIMMKNYMDVSSCDVVLANVPKVINDRRPSYGTVFEIAWGYSLRKPVLIVSDDTIFLNHPLVMLAGIHLASIKEGVEYINALMSEYSKGVVPNRKKNGTCDEPGCTDDWHYVFSDHGINRRTCRDHRPWEFYD